MQLSGAIIVASDENMVQQYHRRKKEQKRDIKKIRIKIKLQTAQKHTAYTRRNRPPLPSSWFADSAAKMYSTFIRTGILG